MVIWRKVDQEEWLELIETKIIDLDKRLRQLEDLVLRLLTQSHPLAEVINKEAQIIFKRQKQFTKMEMLYKGVNLMMIVNIYLRLEKLSSLLKESNLTKKSLRVLYASLIEAYNYLLNNIEVHLTDDCPLYLFSEDIPNPLVVSKSELERYRLEIEV